MRKHKGNIITPKYKYRSPFTTQGNCPACAQQCAHLYSSYLTIYIHNYFISTYFMNFRTVIPGAMKPVWN